MSVDFRAYLGVGYMIPTELRDRINEATDYEYEDKFMYTDAYYADADEVFFGNLILSADPGYYKSLDEIKPLEVDKIDKIIEAAGVSKEFEGIFPKVYLIHRVS
jgi:hypothetical protein